MIFPLLLILMMFSEYLFCRTNAKSCFCHQYQNNQLNISIDNIAFRTFIARYQQPSREKLKYLVVFSPYLIGEKIQIARTEESIILRRHIATQCCTITQEKLILLLLLVGFVENSAESLEIKLKRIIQVPVTYLISSFLQKFSYRHFLSKCISTVNQQDHSPASTIPFITIRQITVFQRRFDLHVQCDSISSIITFLND